MIIARIDPTPPLSPGRTIPPERGAPTTLRSATTPTTPVILLTGCLPVQLSLSTGQVAQWSVKAYPLSVSAPPVVAPANGAAVLLSTNAGGFFSVHAVVGLQTYDWFVRFIELEVIRPDPGGMETDGMPDMSPHRIGMVAVMAFFGCSARIRLRGSDEQPSCYNDVTPGILQDMFWIQDQTLYGAFCRRGTNQIKGYLFEPIPRAASPNIDAGDEEKFPFYDAKVEPENGPLRRVKFDDMPGIVIPVLYNPAIGFQKDFDPNWAKDPAYLLLRKVGGYVSFRSAVGAKCKQAPNTYVVGGAIQWNLIFNQRIKEIPPQAYDGGFFSIDFKDYLAVSTPPNGTVLGNPAVQIFPGPMDACAAGVETFGPEATKTTKQYQWHQRSGVLI